MQERAELLKSADVRCLDAAAQFVGLKGPMELVKSQGLSFVSAAGKGNPQV